MYIYIHIHIKEQKWRLRKTLSKVNLDFNICDPKQLIISNKNNNNNNETTSAPAVNKHTSLLHIAACQEGASLFILHHRGDYYCSVQPASQHAEVGAELN